MLSASQSYKASAQYNDSPGVPNFAPRFIQVQVSSNLGDRDVDYLTMAGAKPMLGRLPLACGCAGGPARVGTTRPGYPIPEDWCGYHLLVDHYSLPLDPESEFRFLPDDISQGTGLVMMNYPHNSSGQVATGS